MTVLITLTVYGSDTGPFFDLYSNIDGYTTAFETNVAKAALIAGYTSSLVPDFATTIRLQSTGECTNYVDIVVIPTTTTTSSSSTSTSTTTAAPLEEGTCYSIWIPTAALTNGIDNLYIEYRNPEDVLVDVDYSTLPETGEWGDGVVINLCSMIYPLFQYGGAGPNFDPTTEGILIYENGTCSEDVDCASYTTTTTTTL